MKGACKTQKGTSHSSASDLALFRETLPIAPTIPFAVYVATVQVFPPCVRRMNSQTLERLPDSFACIHGDRSMRDVWFQIRTVREWLVAKPVSYLTLALLVWGLNWLNIQQVQFEQRGTIAISRQRLEALQSLANLGPKAGPYTFLECRPIVGDDTVPDHSDMCTIKFRVRSTRYIDLAKFEEYLLSKTEPREPSSECISLLREIRTTDWKREALLHQCRCLELQRQKSLDYAAIGEAASAIADATTTEPSDEHAEGGTYRLAGYQKTTESQSQEPSIDALRSELLAQCRDCDAKVASLKQWHANSHASSIGYLSLTGSQQKYPVVQPVQGSKLAILLLLATSAWGLIAIALNRFPKLQPWIDQLRGKAIHNNRSTHRRGAKPLARCDLGIPFLGTIEIVHTDLISAADPFEHVDAPSEFSTPKPTDAERWNDRLPKRTSRGRLRIQQSAALALSLWLAVCGLRLLSDSAWRELFLASPLAGLTHLISGVP